MVMILIYDMNGISYFEMDESDTFLVVFDHLCCLLDDRKDL